MRKSICAAVLVFVVVGRATAEEPTLNQPLECMKQYKMKEFPVIAWCFHNYEGTDYNDEYAQKVKAANFNVVVETGYMMDACRKAGLKVLYYSQTEDKLTERDVWGTKRTHPAQKDWATPAWLKENLAKYGDNPALVGYVIGSNYGRRSVPSGPVECAKWLRENKTGLFPWLAYCWDVEGQAKAGLSILSIECYRRKTHKGFGYDNKGWAHDKRNSYCGILEDGRVIANKFNLAFWPMFPAVTASKGQGEVVGSTHGQSEIRFQVLSAIAYGAQGVVYFVYSTTREVWKPEGTTYKAAQDVNKLVTEVIGPRVLGHRSIGVYCSRPDAPEKLRVKPPQGALAPGEGQLIEKMDGGVMAGVLVKEADFKSGANTPAYVMVIDARTAPLQYEKELKERTFKLTFGPQVKAVEILGAPGEPTKTAAREISLTLRPGDGRLLKVTLAEGAVKAAPADAGKN